MTIQEQIDVMTAFRDGKDIEIRALSEREWEPCSAPLWNFTEFDYRVKPEPRRFFRNLYDNGDFAGFYHTKEQANACASPRMVRVVEFVEVLE